MSDPRFPNRPDHPDFWLISQGLIEQDAQAESDPAIQNIDDVTSRYVDLASVSYHALNRARFIMGAGAPERTTVKGAAMWMDGFVQGIRFQHLKNPTPVDDPAPVRVQWLRDDWDSRPGLTDESRQALEALPDTKLADAIETAFAEHEDMWFHVLDNTRGDATRALLAELGFEEED